MWENPWMAISELFQGIKDFSESSRESFSYTLMKSLTTRLTTVRERVGEFHRILSYLEHNREHLFNSLSSPTKL